MPENNAHDDRGLLSAIPTNALVEELAKREGVTEKPVGVEDRYLIIAGTDPRPCEGTGPATILVVND